MKVVVRSSSLLFTLLSIVLQVPIRRAKRSDAGTVSSAENNPSENTTKRYRTPADSRAQAAIAVGGQRDNDLL
jgi:hypothetical protein